MNQIKVLIIDDSKVIHILFEKIISLNRDIVIIGDAYDGKEGVDLVKRLSPDVVIMDIGMPKMNGLEAIQEIMNDKPTPIVVFSSAGKNNADIGFKAIELGAVQLIEKPSVNDRSLLQKNIEENLIKAIRTFADFKVIRHIKRKTVSPLYLKKDLKIIKETNIELSDKEIVLSKSLNNFPVIGVAASTGGPQTIRILIEGLSARKISAAMIIVQHMADGFMQGFCDWLAKYSSMPVLLPRDGENVEPGRIYVAPGEHHLIFNKNGSFVFLDSPPVQGIRPSANIMFSSMAETFKDRVIAVVLTGMGDDGTEGLYKVKENNGYIISQNEESSLIFGMPKAAIETGLVDKIINISDLSGYLEEFCKVRFSVRV